MSPISLAVCASGSGSNAEAICKAFSAESDLRVSLILCNRKRAGVISRAQRLGVTVELISDELLDQHPEEVLRLLRDHEIDFLALAGFLRLLPSEIVQAYSGRAFNIHPSLLPKYGGRGMYGLRVHQAVLEAQERESGMSIHEINEVYDQGRIIFQKSIDVGTKDPRLLAKAINQLELRYYPQVLAEEIRKRSALPRKQKMNLTL